MSETKLPPLPPYVYGRETAPNEHVYTPDHMRAYARAAVKDERERCAVVAETIPLEAFMSQSGVAQRETNRAAIAAAIRAQN